MERNATQVLVFLIAMVFKKLQNIAYDKAKLGREL